MRHEHRLELDVRFETDALQEVRDQVLVRVALEPLAEEGQVEVSVQRQRHVKRHGAGRSLEREVPDPPARPGEHGFLPKRERLWS